MKNIISVLILFILFFIAPSTGAEGVTVALVGTASKSRPKVEYTNSTSLSTDSLSSTGSFSNKFGYGGGLIVTLPPSLGKKLIGESSGKAFVGIPVTLNLGIEVGALYLVRKYTSDQATSTGAPPSPYKILQFPVVFRLLLGEAISIGGGFFYARPKDSIPTTYSINGSEYGALASLKFNFFPNSPMGFIVDGRYSMTLSNTSSALGTSVKYNDIQVISGIRFGKSK